MRIVGIALAWSISACAAGPITEVSVRDAQFQVVKKLSEPELVQFNQQWQNKREVQVPLKEAGGTHFKLDVEHQNSGGRWLYYTTGFVSLLAHNRQPVYQISEPVQFNKLIGAEQ